MDIRRVQSARYMNEEASVSNPVMSHNPYFQQTQQRPNNYGAPTSPNQYGNNPYTQLNTMTAGQQQFQMPQSPFDATPASDRMTYTDAMNKTAIILATTVITAILTVSLLPMNMWMPAAWVSIIGSFVLMFVLAFKRIVSPFLAIAYGVLEGVSLGAITGAFELIYPGIAFQAILATVVIVAVTLGLHYSGAVRTTPKGRKFVYVVSVGYLVFSLINVVLLAFGVLDNWGFHNGPLGIVIGAAMILVAAYMLIGDFEDVKVAIANGAPKAFAWTVGLGIVATILWIYMEVLRLLAIFASNNR